MNTALTPLFAEEITLEEAYEEASMPFKEFMSKHTRQKDLELFLRYNKAERPESIEDIPLTMLVPAFALSEIKTAFQMGFMIFIPFLSNRYDCSECSYVDGDDDVTTSYDFIAI